MPNAKLGALVFVTLSVLSLGCGANEPAARSNPPATQPTAKPVASDPVPDIPDYPGATRTAYTRGDDIGQGFSKTVKVQALTSDPDDKVTEFYGKLLKDNGWKMANIESSVESVAESKSRMTFTASKGTSIAKIEINQKGKGNVVITVERKDN